MVLITNKMNKVIISNLDQLNSMDIDKNPTYLNFDDGFDQPLKSNTIPPSLVPSTHLIFGGRSRVQKRNRY